MEPIQPAPTAPASAPAPANPPAASQPKTSYGALVALVLIVAAIVAGAFYLFTQKADIYSPAIDELGTQGDSTEPATIESDLAAESPDDFDTEFDKAFAELEASFETE